MGSLLPSLPHSSFPHPLLSIISSSLINLLPHSSHSHVLIVSSLPLNHPLTHLFVFLLTFSSLTHLSFNSSLHQTPTYPFTCGHFLLSFLFFISLFFFFFFFFLLSFFISQLVSVLSFTLSVLIWSCGWFVNSMCIHQTSEITNTTSTKGHTTKNRNHRANITAHRDFSLRLNIPGLEWNRWW